MNRACGMRRDPCRDPGDTAPEVPGSQVQLVGLALAQGFQREPVVSEVVCGFSTLSNLPSLSWPTGASAWRGLAESTFLTWLAANYPVTR